MYLDKQCVQTYLISFLYRIEVQKVQIYEEQAQNDVNGIMN